MVEIKTTDGTETWVNPACVQLVYSDKGVTTIVWEGGTIKAAGSVSDVALLVRNWHPLEKLRADIQQMSNEGNQLDVRILEMP